MRRGHLFSSWSGLGAFALAAGAILALLSCGGERAPRFDILIRGGTVYDGTGAPGISADVGIVLDQVAAVGDLGRERGRVELEANGLAVAPGFVNMLSWATESLLVDGRAQSDIRQGVTLEVFGEGFSMGPLNQSMKERMLVRQTNIRVEVDWTTLGEYLESLERRGVSVNVASFVGATTVRVHELGYADRAPSAEELERMKSLVRQGMEEGAVGVGSSLIYAPAFYAETDELVELARVAGEFGGTYISHMRSEGVRLLEAVDELLHIARTSGARGEIYHLKASGKDNWGKMAEVIRKVEEARAAGLPVGADMYTYPAGATGLDAAMPPWVQEGGFDAWVARLRDPKTRARVEAEMRRPTKEWENMFEQSGPAGMLLVGFAKPELRRYLGKTLEQVAAERGRPAESVAIDLVIEDGTRVDTVYFMMSEDNIRRQIPLPWVAFGSDAGAPSAEGVFLENSDHPRAYGNLARLLGRYVRDEKLIPLEEAIRRLTSMPAENLKLRQRGRLAVGYYADVAVFDPQAITDHATFEQPHQYSTGVRHVLVNGALVLRDGEPTGAFSGRVVRGPGWTGWSGQAAEPATGGQ